MCGIFGFNWEDNALLKRMSAVLKHRGPDDSGYFIDEKISLGHTRLSIIDLSEKGRNPIFNDKGNLCIIFNGEVYNFQEIRETLKKKSKLSSATDTEVVLYAYEQYGINALKKLNGMFAFAIYDSDKRELFIARDRLGIKPLYYYYDGEKFIFASEIKAILECPEVKREIDTEAMKTFFTYKFTPGTKTLFKNIYKLAPGHYLVCKNNKLMIKQYWDVEFKEGKESEEYYAKEILEHLKKSVNYMLISDVPLGAYLSGGLDSSAIVALMSQLTDKVKTFNVSFDDEKYDESKYARLVAEKFGTEHHQIHVKCDAIKVLPKVVYHLDEPLADPACIPTYLMAKETSKHVTVVLSGEGSDELFAGYYKKYRNLMLNKQLASLPKFIRSINLPLNKFMERGFNMLKNADNDSKAYYEFNSVFNEKEKKGLFINNMDKIGEFNLRPYFSKKASYLNKLLYFDIKTWLPERMCLKNDKMSMAHSIEARVPFLDHNLVEFAATIPSSLKIKDGKEKYIYRKAIQAILPKEILQRKKTGFSIPLRKWMQEGLKDYAYDMFRDNQLFNQDYVHGVIRKCDNAVRKYDAAEHYNSVFYTRQFWTLLMFQLWYKRFIDNEKY